jgi:hypothetical protein
MAKTMSFENNIGRSINKKLVLKIKKNAANSYATAYAAYPTARIKAQAAQQ